MTSLLPMDLRDDDNETDHRDGEDGTGDDRDDDGD